MGEVKDSKKAILARQKIETLIQSLENRTEKKKNLSAKEFLELMEEIRSIAIDLNLLSQLSDTSQNARFMMELVNVPRPWWLPANNDWEQVSKALQIITRIGVGAIPIVGDAIDLYEVLTGKDYFSGEQLSYGERIASTLSLIAGSGHQWREVTDALYGIPKNGIAAIDPKKVSEAAKIAKDAIQITFFLINIRALFKTVSRDPIEIAKEVGPKYRLIKDKENHEVMTKLAKEFENKNIPDNWGAFPTAPRYGEGKYQGFDFSHPDNPNIRLRVMPGDKKSKFPNSRENYVRQTIGENSVDKKGNLVKHESDEAHIPLKDYQFSEYWKNHDTD